ncbi:MAG: DUF5615 family PIN-like protein [Phycisphaeraceae bacterium]
MRFLVDRCAGRRLAEWLTSEGHDVIESRSLGPDPGDEALLQIALDQKRIVVTIDTDFGSLAFRDGQPHCGIVRLPDVPADRRIAMMAILLASRAQDLEAGAVVTVRGGKVRVTRPG